jgi:ATP-dependent RNA helicase DDX24/MAK5
MGPQTKKRKLQSVAGPVPKRNKTPSTSLKTSKTKTKVAKPPSRRTVDAENLAWKSVDEDEFGCLQVIEGVDVAKEGDKIRFLVSDSQQQAEQDIEDEGESFEGFGDDAVAGTNIATGEDGPTENGMEDADAQEQAQAGEGEEEAKIDKRQAKKQQKQKRAESQLEKDAGLQEPPAHGKKQQHKQKQGNSFDALVDMADEDNGDEGGDVDVAAWAKLSVSPQMLSAIAKLGFSKPTAIQEQAIPEILAGEDVVGKAQTGSGKTLAFGIPMVEKWLEMHDEDGDNDDKDEEKSHAPMAVVLSPTRELAKQIGEHFKALCNGLSSSPYVCVVTGGLSIQKQRRQLEKADIVVATPGRLWEVLEGDGPLQDSFTAIRFLVVDEADRLFKAGQFKEVEDILGALDKKDPEAGDSESDDDEELPPRQTLVFSATFDKELQTKLAGKGKKKKAAGDEEDQMAYLMKSLKFRQQPKFIDVNPVRQMAVGLREGLIECGAMEKVRQNATRT